METLGQFSSLYAHLWLYQGQDIPVVIDCLQHRLELLVPKLFQDITTKQKTAMVRSTMANSVACYPAACAIAGI